MKIDLQTIIKIGVSLAALAVLVIVLRGVNFSDALSTLLRANLTLLLIVLLVQALSTFLRLVRWRYQLRPRQQVPLGALLSPLLVSYAVGNLTVTGVGMVPRVYLLNRRTGINSAFIAGTWAQEFVVDANAVVLLAIIVPFFVELPSQFREAQIVLLLPMALLLLIDLALWRRKSLFLGLLTRLGLKERIMSRLPDLFRRDLGSFGQGFSAAFASPITFAVVLLTSMLVWALEVVIFWLLLLSIGLPFDYLQAAAVVAFTHVVIGIPSLPGFIGTLEATTVTMVIALGGIQSAALAYAVLLRVFLTVPSTLVGSAFALREGLRIGGK